LRVSPLRVKISLVFYGSRLLCSLQIYDAIRQSARCLSLKVFWTEDIFYL
jgi:hypothetical protein